MIELPKHPKGFDWANAPWPVDKATGEVLLGPEDMFYLANMIMYHVRLGHEDHFVIADDVEHDLKVAISSRRGNKRHERCLNASWAFVDLAAFFLHWDELTPAQKIVAQARWSVEDEKEVDRLARYLAEPGDEIDRWPPDPPKVEIVCALTRGNGKVPRDALFGSSKALEDLFKPPAPAAPTKTEHPKPKPVTVPARAMPSDLTGGKGKGVDFGKLLIETYRKKLNALQVVAFDALLRGENVYLTGPAGTGKSFVLTSYLKSVDRSTVAVTASTGIAALNVGGNTLHSWLGITPSVQAAEDVLHRKGWWTYTAPGIQDVRRLVIEEVSMVDGRLFAMAEILCRKARRSDKPWGGLQVICLGDFGQLAPVEAQNYGWCFQVDAWEKAEFRVIELAQPMRTSDPTLCTVLAEARLGRLSRRSAEILATRLNAYDPDVTGATRLVTHNEQAESLNQRKLEQLPGEEGEFRAIDEGIPKFLEKLIRDCTSPTVLRIRRGARVMFTRNDPGGAFVNGTTGTVESWSSEIVNVRVDPRGGEGPGWSLQVQRATWEKSDRRDKILASRKQFPLRLAWAITIHKSQGCTIPRVSCDLTRVFTPGQAYVAISRVRDLEGLNIEGWQGAASFTAHEYATGFQHAKRWDRAEEAAAGAPDPGFPQPWAPDDEDDLPF